MHTLSTLTLDLQCLQLTPSSTLGRTSSISEPLSIESLSRVSFEQKEPITLSFQWSSNLRMASFKILGSRMISRLSKFVAGAFKIWVERLLRLSYLFVSRDVAPGRHDPNSSSRLKDATQMTSRT